MARILIVEDEQQIAKLMGKILAPFGRIELAHDGGSGYLKYLKNRHDIVICDVAMPISDGLEMAKRIRALSDNVPIIVISAFSEKAQLLRAIDVRVNKYLIKPINPEELIKVVREILEQTNATVALGEAAVDFSAAMFIRSNGEQIALSRREVELFRLLANPISSVHSLEEIKRICWPERSVQDGSVRTLIKRLRDKMGDDAKLLGNQSSAGYKLL